MGDEIAEILAKMKDKYLDELSLKMDEVEENIIAFEKDQNPINIFDEIFRQIHTLKGSSGTYGIHELSRVFHQMEDFLSELADRNLKIEPLDIDFMLQCVDVIRSYKDSDSGKQKFQNSIENILKKGDEQRKSNVLIIENSRLTINMIRNILADLPIKIASVNSGLEAISRLHLENFQIVITAFEMSLIDGAGIIAAARQSSAWNKNSFYIMMTSKENIIFSNNAKPDLILKKDNHLFKNIRAACEEKIGIKPV